MSGILFLNSLALDAIEKHKTMRPRITSPLDQTEEAIFFQPKFYGHRRMQSDN
jgi:hypothetical protein